jgi:FtsZ-interacting cell division protein ZipA
MSDLQWSLLLLGAVVVAGVYAFNRIQERSYRRMAERSMPQPREDVLMDEALSSPRLPPDELPGRFDRVPAGSLPTPQVPEPPETPAPQLPRPADAPARPPARLPSATATRAHQAPVQPEAATTPPETAVDFPALLRAAEPLGQAALDELEALTAGLVRPVQLNVMDEARGQWIPLPESAGGRFRTLRAGMALADRQGVARAHDLEGFASALEAFAERHGSEVVFPDVAPFEARGRALDELCGEVDIAVGLSVVARTGQSFQGTTIRALAEAAGMRLKPDGQFHAEGEGGAPQFTLDNQGSEPFFADTLRTLSTPGITLLLDVPRATGGLASFDRMVQLARQFAKSLDGLIVDDNRRSLDDAGLDATRRALAGVYARMEAAGIPPGGPVAQRLFR